MKNYEISRNFGTGLESIVDTNSHRNIGNICGSPQDFNRPVCDTYTGVQVGVLKTNYGFHPIFHDNNYGLGTGMPVDEGGW